MIMNIMDPIIKPGKLCGYLDQVSGVIRAPSTKENYVVFEEIYNQNGIDYT